MKAEYPPDSDDSALGTKHDLRVLIADDNIYFLNVVCHFLEICGHQTNRVTNGKDALGLIQGSKTQYDTILVEDSIDGGAGLRLLGDLRDGGYQGRIVIKSGKLSPTLKEAYQSLGADAFIEIPVDMRHLLRLVQTPSAGTTAQP
jgi:CheY-like chemotaxis protein